MGFVVRPAARSDAECIAHLHVATWQEAYSRLLPNDFFDADNSRMRLEMWTQILSRSQDEWIIRVAEIEQRVVGFAMSGPSFGSDPQDLPRECQIYNIYVFERAHGTGIGQTLLDQVVGAQPAMLWVAKQNPRAIAFYRRNGFEFDGAEQIDPGAPKITDARMVR